MYLDPPEEPFIHKEEGYLLNPKIDTLQTLLNLRSSTHYFQKRLKEIIDDIRNSF